MGGFACAVVTRERALTELLARRYQGFVSDNPPHFTLTARVNDRAAVQGGPLEIQMGPVTIERHAQRLVLAGEGFSAECDLAQRTGTIVQPLNLSPLDLLLKALSTHYLLREGAGFVHGCAVRRRGDGYLFFGPTGSGKSTLATLAGEGVLADELVILHQRGSAFELHGTPFWGGRNATAELVGLFALCPEHRKDTVTRMTPTEALRRLLPCMGNFLGDAECQAWLFDLAGALVQSTVCQELRFSTITSLKGWLDAHLG